MNKNRTILPGRGSAPLRKLDKRTIDKSIVYEGPKHAELSVLVVDPDEKVRTCFLQFCKQACIQCGLVTIVPDKITAIAYINDGLCDAVITNILMYDGSGHQPEPTVSQSRVFGRYVDRNKPGSTRLHYALGGVKSSLRRYLGDLCPSDSDTVPFTTNGHIVSPEIDGIGVPTTDGCRSLFRCIFTMHELKVGDQINSFKHRLIGWRYGDEGKNCNALLKRRLDSNIRRVFTKYHV